ncbi:L-asparaginase 1 [bacterium]|nr:L-asparaginase 1 [bacterium]
MNPVPHIHLMYTGGTIGMGMLESGGALSPLDFDDLMEKLPELRQLPYEISWSSFEPPLDSSDLGPDQWIRLADEIAALREVCQGFVVLHGSDTMAYSASALSFMLRGLNLPVILTGSQLPIGVMRSDARENLLTSIEIAASLGPDGLPRVQEVCIYFEYALMRGNRCYKHNAENFDAFDSPNWPLLAEAGVHLRFNESALLPPSPKPFSLHRVLERGVGVLYLFPGLRIEQLKHRFSDPEVKAWVLYSFGNGNAFSDPGFLMMLEQALETGKALVNVSQCPAGSVLQGKYATSKGMAALGIASGRDITIESALTKLMVLGGLGLRGKAWMQAFEEPWCGEMAVL